MYYIHYHVIVWQVQGVIQHNPQTYGKRYVSSKPIHGIGLDSEYDHTICCGQDLAMHWNLIAISIQYSGAIEK